MATVGNTYLNLADAAKRKDPDGKTASIVELLSKTNTMIDDMPFVECNDGARHLTTVRTGIPTVGYRQLYKGVARSKSTTAQVWDTTAMLTAMQEVDELLLDMDSDPAGLMFSESQAFIESLNQQFATDLLYADLAANPEKFHGFGPRYNALSNAQLVSAGTGGTNTNTSIWFVIWGPSTVHGIFPKGTMAGISQKSRGRQRVTDANSDPYYAECVDWFWHVGLTVRDPRAIVRVCNIDTATLTTAGSGSDTSQDLTLAMMKAFHKFGHLPNLGTNFRIYANATVLTYLDIQIQKKLNYNLTWDMITGARPQMRFNGVPIMQMDAITSTEATIS